MANEALTSGQCVASFVPPASLVNSNIYKYISERNAALATREVKVYTLLDGPDWHCLHECCAAMC